MSEIGKEIQRAKIHLLLKEAFFGNLLMHLKILPDNKIPTFSTNGRYIKYSPSYARQLTRSGIAAVLAHEVMHCVFKHHITRKGRDPKLWNDAGDYCINWILAESGFNLPRSSLIDSRFADMSTEQIYNILLAENPPKPKSKPKVSGGEGEGEGGGEGEGEGGDQGTQTKQDGSPDDEDNPGDECNEGVDKDITPVSCGEVEDAPSIKEGKGPDVIEQESKAWSQRIVQAAMNAKLAGKLPAGLDRLISDILAPKVSWKEILWQFVQEVAHEDYSFLRPNRKYISGGIFLPSLYSEASLDIVVAVDTSCSISQKDLTQAASELCEIQNSIDATIHVVYVDTEVANTQVFEPGDEVKLKAKGGGGTDFVPAFEWAEEKQLDIACMIYLTDGYCSSFPEQEPEYPVLWITNRRHWSTPFGEIVEF